MENRHLSSALGEFIKSRRYRLQPEDAGIKPFPGRRRTPGLRREEVAYLANVSVTYYTWLEQGRERNPSPEILSHISQALQLDADERKHLFDLAAPSQVSFSMTQRPEKPDTGLLQNLVDQMRYPSFIANEVADMIVWNRGAELVVADFGRLPESERNMVTLLFLDPEYPKRLVNWEEFARYMTALIRAGFDSNKDNPQYMERYERLRRNSEDFIRLWEWHEIRQKSTVPVHYRLPDGQMLEFTIHCAAAIDNDPGLHWCFFVPTPGSGTEERLALLLTQDSESSPSS
ncbi:helix-turn-helix transcriptional regulator [Paenibacillus sp. p3-SID867]|uniref:helix-turn-helix domain-containing protein n=1 Tax=Paenibacillus sp. p3-SID867 TaxID=2916363 RepID=UPI0021A9702B|nr:helix-turn-helix transcriptional regulator [Paenibacillus sp. p3-SID867]MCT1402953.1 helix-turn-helix transcriptional regulator [Paenibacillus sp. p3-SID867]